MNATVEHDGLAHVLEDDAAAADFVSGSNRHDLHRLVVIIHTLLGYETWDELLLHRTINTRALLYYCVRGCTPHLLSGHLPARRGHRLLTADTETVVVLIVLIF